MKNDDRFEKLKNWVDGTGPEHKHMQRSHYIDAAHYTETKPEKTAAEQKESFNHFFGVYKIIAAILVGVIAVFFFVVIFSMPEFGNPANPTNNEVVERYVGSAEHETGAENVIAGMILNYRGFDTFGESCVLFIAACCVMMLLWRDKNCFTEEDRIALEAEEKHTERDVRNPILMEQKKCLTQRFLFQVSSL